MSSNLIIPKNYHPIISPQETEKAIKKVKDFFERALADALSLRRVTAPLFVLSGTGINDDLNGVENPVSFTVKCMGQKAEIVHSLAKWKRIKLQQYNVPPGKGIYTDMNAIRSDEELDNIHSLYVDQWDWEKTINDSDRNIEYLEQTVRTIYTAMKRTEKMVTDAYPQIQPILPEEITFIHSEDLLALYPTLSSKEREAAIARKHGAVFIIGIGSLLSNGEKHDGRAPDYDDWITPTNGDKYRGLNGDIVLWNPVLECPFEISSMGIRVDKDALLEQLKITNNEYRKEFEFHKSLLAGELPLSMGGGIGQSRLCMFFLRKAHIGEVQASIWSEEMRRICAENNIFLD
ncbi:MAG: aspartate--ammonia ligase [Prevotellaceae bacterium]|jgi:aspartate--ammonia ligase|nr:aspartate--ammonia ligase [Prevotellaceae bacterium]